ncbi:hypothetical protein P691DRAFT_768375 [Macrolepiota fuliginosa MF-IS2]|uniref:Uncharacterized protein n=1 Tax=Macrolepiota fuliginosa MF-IS2 TaxID=1400762 RepID=A0A9P5WW88_9AGAR|nr:hypothetical protein P691DRAFT_768375 [Macrolepiota fuliginosa MF-IS2]
MPPKKTALCFEDLTVQQWEELMQEYIAQRSSMGDAGSEGMEVDVDDLGEVAKRHRELEGSQVVSWEKGKKKVKAKWVETSEEEGNYPGTDEYFGDKVDCLVDKMLGMCMSQGETWDAMDQVVNALERDADEYSDQGMNVLDRNMELNWELREALDQNTLQLKSAQKYWEQEDVEEHGEGSSRKVYKDF